MPPRVSPLCVWMTYHLNMLVILLAVLAASPPAPRCAPPEARLIEGVAAVIDGQPLFLSELTFEARVAIVLRGGSAALDPPLTIDQLASALEFAIAQRLGAREAERLQVFAPSTEEIALALAAFAERIPPNGRLPEWLTRQEVTERQLSAALARGLRANRYFESRLRAAGGFGERELRGWYEAHRADYGDAPYEAVRDSIRAAMSRSRAEETLKRQLAELEERFPVRRLPPFAQSAAPSP